MCLGVLFGGVWVARWTQIDAIARADMPWSAVWRGSGRSMDTNRCHRASGCALQARRMAIAVPGEFHESEERVQHEERVQSVERVQPPPSAPEYKGTGV